MLMDANFTKNCLQEMVKNLSDFQRAVDFCLIALLFLAIAADARKRLTKAVLRQVALNGLKIWIVFCKTMKKEFLSFWTRHILVRANQNFMAKRAIYTQILTTSGCVNP